MANDALLFAPPPAPTVEPPVVAPPAPAPGNVPAPPAPAPGPPAKDPGGKSDGNPQKNGPGRVRRSPPRVPFSRGNLLWEGLKLAGRILFDPNVFGDNSAYFADMPTIDAYEYGLVKQGDIDIKQGGMDPGEVRARVRQEIEAHRKELAEKDPKKEGKPDENTKVDDPCKVVPYKDQKCPEGYEAHHIVPDSVMRYGTRGDAEARITGMPALDEGMSICLKGSAFVNGTEHKRMHQAVDAAIAEAGDEFNLAKLKDILKLVEKETAQIKPECKEQIKKGLKEGFKGLDKDTLVRTSKQPLKPK